MALAAVVLAIEVAEPAPEAEAAVLTVDGVTVPAVEVAELAPCRWWPSRWRSLCSRSTP